MFKQDVICVHTPQCYSHYHAQCHAVYDIIYISPLLSPSELIVHAVNSQYNIVVYMHL